MEIPSWSGTFVNKVRMEWDLIYFKWVNENGQGPGEENSRPELEYQLEVSEASARKFLKLFTNSLWTIVLVTKRLKFSEIAEARDFC